MASSSHDPAGHDPAVHDQQSVAARFLELHHGDSPLLMPNPWDVGSAVALESLGFKALATTSSGFAATLGRLDGSVSVDEAVEHCRLVASAVAVPLSADFEGGYAVDPATVAANVARAKATGLAGCSIEDSTDDDAEPVFDFELARERVAAAVASAHEGDVHLVLTARAENHIVGRPDLGDTILRLQAFQEAGADVLYAPGLMDPADIRAVVTSVDRPVNVLARPGAPSVAELGELGVSRISVGGGFALAALGALARAAQEVLESGTYGYFEEMAAGRSLVETAFGSR